MKFIVIKKLHPQRFSVSIVIGRHGFRRTKRAADSTKAARLARQKKASKKVAPAKSR